MINPIIVAIGYNRVFALQRLLNALANAYYEEYDAFFESINLKEHLEKMRAVENQTMVL